MDHRVDQPSRFRIERVDPELVRDDGREVGDRQQWQERTAESRPAVGGPARIDIHAGIEDDLHR